MKNNSFFTDDNLETKSNIEAGLVNPHVSRKDDGKWFWCSVYDRKEKVTYRYIWRQFDAESSYMFDRYGIAIELCEGDEDGNPDRKNKKKAPDLRQVLFVLAPTYLPGPLPAKYRRRK